MNLDKVELARVRAISAQNKLEEEVQKAIEGLLTVAEVCELTDYSRSYVTKACQHKIIEPVLIHKGVHYFDPKEVRAKLVRRRRKSCK